MLDRNIKVDSVNNEMFQEIQKIIERNLHLRLEGYKTKAKQYEDNLINENKMLRNELQILKSSEKHLRNSIDALFSDFKDVAAYESKEERLKTYIYRLHSLLDKNKIRYNKKPFRSI